jgi:excisionase family DNA binding protein
MGVRKARLPTKPVLLITEAAEVLGVSQPTLRRWDASGRFPARRHPINGYRLFDTEAVLRLRDEILAGTRAAS